MALPPTVSSLSLDDLTELYFSLEEPSERDAFMNLVAPLRGPEVDALLQAMMQKDEDPFIRHAAAAQLAGRGDAGGLMHLEAQLAEPGESSEFALAIDALVKLRGAAIYPALEAIWLDARRSLDARRDALAGMEGADPRRCAEALIAWVDAQADVAALDEDLLEAAMLSLARRCHPAARQRLVALQERIAASAIDDERRRDLQQFIAQGLALQA